jgi:hypothetical protein
MGHDQQPSHVVLGAQGDLLRSRAETLQDPARQDLVDLTVTGNRLRATCPWVVVDVVPTAVAQEDASGLKQFLDQVQPLHATSRSSTFRIPGICSLVKVAKRSLSCSFRSSRSSPCVQCSG